MSLERTSFAPCAGRPCPRFSRRRNNRDCTFSRIRSVFTPTGREWKRGCCNRPASTHGDQTAGNGPFASRSAGVALRRPICADRLKIAPMWSGFEVSSAAPSSGPIHICMVPDPSCSSASVPSVRAAEIAPRGPGIVRPHEAVRTRWLARQRAPAASRPRPRRRIRQAESTRR